MKLLVILAVIVSASPAEAQVLDALKGHVRDLRDRTQPDAFIAGEVIKRGKIDETAKGQDLLHNSKGGWTLVLSGGVLYVQSGDDFRSSPGPDYHVYVSAKPAIKDNDEFDGSGQIEVGRLVKPNGAAYYKLPASLSASDVRSVLVWCKRFREYIGSADLR